MAKAPKHNTPPDSDLVETIIDALVPGHGGPDKARQTLASWRSVEDVVRALYAAGWNDERVGRALIDAANCDDFGKTPEFDGPVVAVRLPNGALVSPAPPPRSHEPASPRPPVPRSAPSPTPSHNRGVREGRTSGTIMVFHPVPCGRPRATQLQYFTTRPAEPVKFHTAHRVYEGVLLRLLELSTDLQSVPAAAQRAADKSVIGEPPAVGGATASKQLPATRPRGLGPKVWLAAREVHALTREAGVDSKWSDLDAGPPSADPDF
jgi:hypothetical protein